MGSVLVPLMAALPPTSRVPFTQSAHGARPARFGMLTTSAWIWRCALVCVSVVLFVGVHPMEVIRRWSGSVGWLATVTMKPPVAPSTVNVLPSNGAGAGLLASGLARVPAGRATPIGVLPF